MSRSPPRSKRNRLHRTRPRPTRPKAKIVVAFANRQKLLRLPLRRFQSILRRVLGFERITRANVELVLVDDHQIRKLHRDYLNIDTPTDVLTFPLNEAGESLAGIVVVSVETAARQAVQYRMTAIEEVLLYSIHGVLHLCGYDDVAPKDARRMRRRQEALLRECFRPASKRRSPRAS